MASAAAGTSMSTMASSAATGKARQAGATAPVAGTAGSNHGLSPTTPYSGMEVISNLNIQLLRLATEYNQPELESYCRTALLSSGRRDVVEKHDKNRTVKKPTEKSMLEFLPSVSAVSANQRKNQAIRFGMEEQTNSLLQRQAWALSSTKRSLFQSSASSAPAECRDYEDVVSMDILRAPIVDICIIQRGDPIPPGFYRIARTPGNRRACLNSLTQNNLYICIKKDLSAQAIPVTSLVVIFPDKNEFVPPGYFAVRRGKYACNVNAGSNTERVFLCFKKDKQGDAVTDIQVLFPKSEDFPKDFCVIEYSPTNIPANLNIGTIGVYGGVKLALAYRQVHSSLMCLENDAAPVAGLASGLGLHAKKHHDSHLLSNSRSQSMSTDSSLQSGSSASSNSITHDFVPTRRPLSLRSDDGVADSAVLESASGGGMESTSATPGGSSQYSPRRKSTVDTIFTEESDQPFVNGDEESSSDIYSDIEDCASDDADEDIFYADRSGAIVLDCYGKPVLANQRRSLLAVLMGLSLRQNEISILACQGLMKLFRDTDFFVCDLCILPPSSVLTMLDITVEAICSRFYNCQEAEFDGALQFLKVLVRHSCGKLSSICTQRIFKILSFLCNYYSTRTNWLLGGYPNPCLDSGLELPCFRVLKEFVWSVVAQVEVSDVAQVIPLSSKEDNDTLQITPAVSLALDTAFAGMDPYSRMESVKVCSQLSLGVTEEITDSIEACRLANVARLLALQQSTSGSSSSFWEEANKLGRKLFADSSYRTAFVALVALCKLACQKVRLTSKGNPTPRDLGSKLLAIESIADFCATAGEKMKASKIFGVQIRRLVIPVIFSNVSTALNEPRVYNKLLKVLTSLWKSWRLHVRVEFAVIVDRLVIPVLEANSLKIRPGLQMVTVQELLSWVEQPHVLLEMFVNYDMDNNYVSHADIVQKLIDRVCAVARRCSLITGAWDWKPNGAFTPATVLEAMTKPSVNIRDVNAYSMEAASRIIKTIMDAAGHAHLLLVDADFRSRSLECGPLNIEKYVGTNSSPGATRSDQSPGSSPSVKCVTRSLSIHQRRSVTGTASSTLGDSKGWSSSFMAGYRAAMNLESHETLAKGFEIYAAKQSVGKLVNCLVARKYLMHNPFEIARFLRTFQNQLDLADIGDYLGEGGDGADEVEFWNQCRFRYLRALSFVDMEIEPALRLFLTGAGFRLPGEAQKIDRFVEAFQKLYWADNHGSKCCPLKSADTVHILTFAIIMLNTDLHRAQQDNKKKRKQMTQAEFINNLRGSDSGDNIDRNLLCRIYDNIAAHPIELSFDRSETPTSPVPNPLSVEEHVAALEDLSTSRDITSTEEKRIMLSISKNIRESELFLSSIACFPFPFRLTGIETRISMDVVSYLFETVAHLFLPITLDMLGEQRFDMTVTKVALDILCYSLSCAVFLDFEQKRREFADVLYAFQQKCIIQSRSEDEILMSQSWYDSLVGCQVAREDVLEHIAFIHRLVVVLKDVIQQVANTELTRAIAERIDKKAHVLETNSFFVKEGLLGIKSKTGKIETLQAFLFSDELFFCPNTAAANGELKVIDRLSLAALSLADISDDPSGCSFYLSHVSKNFVIIADNPQSKYEWIRDVQEAIRACKKRTVDEDDRPEKGRQRPSLIRKLSIMNRIEEQQTTLNYEYSKRVYPSPRSTSVPDNETNLFNRRRSATMTQHNDHGNGVNSSVLASTSQESNATSMAVELETNPEFSVTDPGSPGPTSISSSDSPMISRGIYSTPPPIKSPPPSSAVATLTPQERVARNATAVQVLAQKLVDMNDKSLTQLFVAVSVNSYGHN
jgi:hypothetical protein